jgi:hypothetical protein
MVILQVYRSLPDAINHFVQGQVHGILPLQRMQYITGNLQSPRDKGPSGAYCTNQIRQYRNCTTIYLSWDAAAWHISRDLIRHVKQRNDEALAEG